MRDLFCSYLSPATRWNSKKQDLYLLRLFKCHSDVCLFPNLEKRLSIIEPHIYTTKECSVIRDVVS